MKKYYFSCCYLPTTVVFIDDNKSFLQNLSLTIDPSLSCEIYDNPQEALDTIRANYNPDPYIARCLNASPNNLLETRGLDIDVSKIHTEIFNPKRFEYVTVAVVDYAMPSLNGLDFCRALQPYNIKKILLTGQADQSMAIDAFNQGIIDKFIDKSMPSLNDMINQSICELQHGWFQELSSVVAQTLQADLPGFFEDPSFGELFRELCAHYEIVEYYLADSSGSFLMLDGRGKPYWLAVKNEEEMATYEQLASDEQAGDDIQGAIARREKIPYFYREADVTTPAKEWGRFLHPCRYFVGKDKYYYAVVEASEHYTLPEGEVGAYFDYLNTL